MTKEEKQRLKSEKIKKKVEEDIEKKRIKTEKANNKFDQHKLFQCNKCNLFEHVYLTGPNKGLTTNCKSTHSKNVLIIDVQNFNKSPKCWDDPISHPSTLHSISTKSTRAEDINTEMESTVPGDNKSDRILNLEIK